MIDEEKNCGICTHLGSAYIDPDPETPNIESYYLCLAQDEKRLDGPVYDCPLWEMMDVDDVDEVVSAWSDQK